MAPDGTWHGTVQFVHDDGAVTVEAVPRGSHEVEWMEIPVGRFLAAPRVGDRCTIRATSTGLIVEGRRRG